MPIPLLPALKDATSENKIAINKPGEWSDGAQNTLSNLVDSLKVAAGKESNISSIPDVWARPALYEAILVNEKHPLHEHYKQEWRGVLAIIAMRKLRNFSDIKVETVDVPKKEKIKESDPAFLKVIARSIPESFLREGKKGPDDEGGLRGQGTDPGHQWHPTCHDVAVHPVLPSIESGDASGH